MKKIALFSFLISLVILAPTVLAQPELPDPGITPDSPFYRLDTFFDRFRSSEVVAGKRVAEIRAMAEENKTEAMERAVEGYERAMERRERDGNRSEGAAEEVARQASNHLAVLAEVRERIPEEAHEGIDRAINNSARGRGRAIEALNRTNPERAHSVAQNTLEEVRANTPEEAQEGLEKALDAVSERGPPTDIQPGPPEEKNDIGEVPEEDEEGQDQAPDTPIDENGDDNVTDGEEAGNSAPDEIPNGQ